MKVRVTKKEWYEAGGFKNSNCFRKQRKNGGWEYWIVLDNA